MSKQHIKSIELGMALIAIIISATALGILIENKPLVGGYTEIGCHKVEYEDGGSACIVKLDRYNDNIRVFKESRQQ